MRFLLFTLFDFIRMHVGSFAWIRPLDLTVNDPQSPCQCHEWRRFLPAIALRGNDLAAGFDARPVSSAEFCR
jgi:hypothetical protein